MQNFWWEGWGWGRGRHKPKGNKVNKKKSDQILTLFLRLAQPKSFSEDAQLDSRTSLRKL